MKRLWRKVREAFLDPPEFSLTGGNTESSFVYLGCRFTRQPSGWWFTSRGPRRVYGPFEQRGRAMRRARQLYEQEQRNESAYPHSGRRTFARPRI